MTFLRCLGWAICGILWFLLLLMVFLICFSLIIGSWIIIYAFVRRADCFVALLFTYLMDNCYIAAADVFLWKCRNCGLGVFWAAWISLSYSCVSFQLRFLSYCFCGPMLIPFFIGKTLWYLLIYLLNLGTIMNIFDFTRFYLVCVLNFVAILV
jgi:hypothetical protein